MCGIVGFNFSDKKIIKNMNNSLKHRGPDGEGYYIDDNVSLGHRRLSIIDLSPKGKQPMFYKDLVIVYNGEIYNFLELKKELVLKGHRFISDCDTEIVLHSYEEWGSDCVNYFNGMWAFCIYNKNKKEFFISRDRFGIKPLYYYWDNKTFIFTSELKSLKALSLDLDIDKKALNFYFYQKYIGDELTIFKNVYKLKPSSNLYFDLKNKNLVLKNYYFLENEIKKAEKVPLNDRLSKIEEVLKDAVIKRLIADVPVGSFLSGGIDSSLISAVIAKNKKDFNTFSIGFNEATYDEIKYSKIVSQHIKTKHHYKYLDIDEDLIKNIVSNLDEPFGDSSIIPTYLLSKITREEVTVSLSGDAGDEVFAGYDTYLAYKVTRLLPNILIKLLKYFIKIIHVSDKKLSLSFKIKKFVKDFDDNVNRRHLNWMSQSNAEERKNILGKNFIDENEIIRFVNDKSLLSVQLNDINNYLPEDILKKVDTASMLNSLETRVPFLDYRLVPLVLSLPEKYKIRFFKTKWFLKKIAGNYIPGKIINRKKRGFTVPLSKWIREGNLIREYLTNKDYFQHNLLNYNYVLNLLNEHLNKKNDNSRILWLVFVFNLWHSINFKKVRK